MTTRKRNIAKKADAPKPAPVVVLEPNPEFLAHVPGKKKVYSYNDDGTFAGATEAFESPLEKGVFHIPARTTEIEPLPVKDGYIVKFSKSKNIWLYEAIVEEPKEEIIISEEERLAEIKRLAIATRNGKLQESDYTQLADVQSKMSIEQIQAWTRYRQDLRDITEQEGFPEAIVWPEKP